MQTVENSSINLLFVTATFTAAFLYSFSFDYRYDNANNEYGEGNQTNSQR